MAKTRKIHGRGLFDSFGKPKELKPELKAKGLAYLASINKEADKLIEQTRAKIAAEDAAKASSKAVVDSLQARLDALRRPKGGRKTRRRKSRKHRK